MELNPTVRKWVQDARNDPTFKWFVGGETNLAYNALDQHVKRGWQEMKAALGQS